MRVGKLISPASLTFFVGFIYLAATIAVAGGDPLELARIGTLFSEGDASGSEGYDGQFVYYIAQNPNPESVKALLDVPAYRYQRILLPMLARTLSLGNANVIAWMLPTISLIAHAAAVFLLSKLLERWSVNRWYAISYGLWLGLLLALRLDLPEALAFGLVIAAIFFEIHRKSRLSWVFYALALFAKETTVIFLGAQLVVYLGNRRWRDLVGLSLVAFLPYALFQLWLLASFDQIGISSGGIRATAWERIPFMGIWRLGEFSMGLMASFLAIYVPILIAPALWGLWVSVRQWKQEGLELTSTALFLNAVIVPFLPFSLYSEPYGAFRFASGLVLASVLFAARQRQGKALNYSLFWLILNLILLNEILG